MRRLSDAYLGAVLLAAATAVVAVPGEAEAIGLLVPERQDVRPFDIESHRVDVTVTNTAAVTEVVQVFRNHTDRRQEASFVFPLPEGATVSDFSLWMGGEEIDGTVLQAGEARRTYESIVRRTEDPGLVEYVDGRLFRASIFPIPPESTKKLKLKFSQTLDRRAGLYRYDYPMRAGSKYITAETEKDFTLTGTLQSPLPITTVYSPTHEIRRTTTPKGRVRISAERMYEKLDRNFELYIGYSKRDVGFNLMTYDPDGEGGRDGYFMAAVAPRMDLEERQTAPQAFTFVVDTSGSMNGDKIRQARETLEFCIEQLDPKDRFNVVRFSTGVERLFLQPRIANEARRGEGVAFARDLEAAGGTATMKALRAALDRQISAEYDHRVVFITDGIPTIGVRDRGEILNRVEAALDARERIFSFGVGFEVNTKLLDGLAKQGRGESDYVKPDEDLERAVTALYDRISSPVLTGIEIEFGGAETYDVYPHPVPDLFQGDQIVVFGRHRAPFDGTITVRGRVGEERRRIEFEPGGSGEEVEKGEGAPIPSSDLAFIPELWATRKVGYLLEQIRLNGERPELRKEIVRLGEKFGLVTPYTSYLAVDDREMRPSRRGRSRSDGERSTDAAPPDRRPAPSSLDDAQRAPRPSPDADQGEGSARSAPAPSDEDDGLFPLFRGSDAADRDSSDSDDGSTMSLDEETGSRAVESAEKNRELKHKDEVGSDGDKTRRYVAGRTFVRREGAWVQEGVTLDASNSDAITEVEVFSEAYFDLAQRYEAVAEAAQLHGEIVLELGGARYRLVPRED